MIILVDLDGVVADLEAAFWPIFHGRYPDAPVISRNERTTFYVEDQIGQEWREFAEPILHEEGFFRNIPLVPDARSGVLRLQKDHEVFFCTAPVSSPHCAQEKALWISEHFGSGWLRRTIIAKDKTLIRGSILIDDRPEVKGLMTPSWEHVLYDQPYNRGVDKPRITWESLLEGSHNWL